MVQLIWETNKVVATPMTTEEENRGSYKGISTTKGNVTSELYPISIVDEIDAISFGNSYDDDGNHRGIYFTFWNADEARQSVKKSRLLSGERLHFQKC